VINNYQAIVQIRAIWISHKGGDGFIFDAAVTALDSATCRANLRSSLRKPPYDLVRSAGSDWHIEVGSVMMLRFRLREDPNSLTAEVDILP
jgi:hypothetical protein